LDERKTFKKRKTIVFIIFKKEGIMPGFNQTGPTGQGPKTGRQMGRCTNFGAKLKSQPTTDTENSEEKLPENILGRGLGGAQLKSHKELANDLLNDSLAAGANYCDH
jgi:hypothetical protein